MIRQHIAFALVAAGMAAAGDLAELPHPRLWFPQSAEAAFRRSLAADPLQARLQAAALAEADTVLKQRTCRYEIPDGLRLLAESRRAVHNVLFSAWAWRTTGRAACRDRAIAELEAACALKDWNPKHFLDTAEMATAVAIGYDWLYRDLTEARRATCERALVAKAFQPAREVYDKRGWWSIPRNNWAQVCGGGIALAAAAAAGRDEGFGEPLFGKGLALVESCRTFYQPDGMYAEGPGYWQYGTSYQVALMAACGPLARPLAALPELSKGGDAMMHLASPNRLVFNFADGSAGRAVPSSAQCWLARHFQHAGQAAYVRGMLERVAEEDPESLARDRFFPLAVLWLPPASPGPAAGAKVAVFGGGQPVACFRSGWQAADAYLAVKGGTPAVSHGHMDVGSLVYDAHGERWVHDLGADDYNLPGYFGKQRWSYHRLQNRAHNTLEIDGRLQDIKAAPCPIIAHDTAGAGPFARFDLTGAYAGAAARVTRTARFDPATGTAVLEDEVERPAGDIVWRMFTDAAVEITRNGARLSKRGQGITLCQTAGGGTWSVASAAPPTAVGNPNKGFRAVTLTVPRAGKVKIAVEFRP